MNKDLKFALSAAALCSVFLVGLTACGSSDDSEKQVIEIKAPEAIESGPEVEKALPAQERKIEEAEVRAVGLDDDTDYE